MWMLILTQIYVIAIYISGLAPHKSRFTPLYILRPGIVDPYMKLMETLYNV